MILIKTLVICPDVVKEDQIFWQIFIKLRITRNDGQNGGGGGLMLRNGVFKKGWSVTIKCM